MVHFCCPIFFARLHATQFVFPRCKLSTRQHADTNQLMRRWTFDLDIPGSIDSSRGQPARCRARPTNVDGWQPQDIRWIRGLGGESLPVMSCVLPDQTNVSHRRGIENFVLSISSTPAAPAAELFSCQTPGQCLPHTTGRCVNTVTLPGWGRLTSAPHSEFMT